mmetsp:Transcript_13023/g.19166  ORF Transcript_13023/g.19166 Transcript_13023/m.19166 type:complete len:522 (-) Transcript_13023:112-1677(-)|eukprot:CAMPEP_0194224702 /NCGR_PEP_ID=MMETSP0156-20130528/38006_1 /TAXON_ID=33649 /ORGANISM="Thalassionema nitzschioides, Strain L26-B" /LENGTH=521 /DNA_ID=CAMNT_0038956381 /DNA_START=79 /DNA_END=1644 /DNA_ORIENTATION=-
MMRNRKGNVNGNGRASPSNVYKEKTKNPLKFQFIVGGCLIFLVVLLFFSAIYDERDRASHNTHTSSSKGSSVSRLMSSSKKKLKHGILSYYDAANDWKNQPFKKKKSYGVAKKTMQPCPEQYKRTFYMEVKKINQPVSRALRMMGWKKTDNYEEAQVIWTYASTSSWYKELKPWQRYNHIPGYKAWNQKDSFVTYMLEYQKKSGKPLPACPETYRLDEKEGLAAFKKRLYKQGGMDIPWVLKKPNVNQGKGIAMLGPNSKELKEVFDYVEEEKEEQNYIIQRYVCNEMTFPPSRKFDFRIFWIVASLDPLVLMYHDGYVRVGNSDYNEGDFSSTTAHLTTHTGLSEEGKGTWDDFDDLVHEAYRRGGKEMKKRLKGVDPLDHVRNQVKQALGEMAAAFQKVTFNADQISSENGFAFYGGDFIIDWDLDVFFIEPQHGCGLDEDHQFRVEMHNSLFTEMIDASYEVWQRQEMGLGLDNLQHTGGYEVVYNDGWMYEYKGYERNQNKKGCAIPQKKMKNKEYK